MSLFLFLVCQLTCHCVFPFINFMIVWRVRILGFSVFLFSLCISFLLSCYFSFVIFICFCLIILLLLFFSVAKSRFLRYRQDCNEDISDLFAQIFRDKYRTPLKNVALRNCTITDDGMTALLQHDLVSLSLWYCDNVTTSSWPILIDHGHNLRFLELGKYVDMLKYSEPNEKAPIDFQLQLPKLQKLILTDVVLQPTVQFSHLRELTYLDLTSCTFAEFNLETILNLPNLITLILFDVWPLESEIPTICRMKQLQKLDISTAHVNVSNGIYKNPNEVSFLCLKLNIFEYYESFAPSRCRRWRKLSKVYQI